MKTYEVVFEIFNSCSGNQMRDVFFNEMEFEDEEAIDRYVHSRHEEKDIEWDRVVLDDGVIIYNIVAAGLKQRYSFTECWFRANG